MRPEPDQRSVTDDVTPSVEVADRAELVGEVLAGMRQFSMVITEMVEAAMGARLASNTELITLITLDLDGPQRPRSLVDRTGFTTGGMTNLLDRLEADGLVRRIRTVDGDGRGVRVELTADGTALVDRAAGAVSRAFALAGALTARWAEILNELGYAVGTSRLAHASRREHLAHIARLGEWAERLQARWKRIFGEHNPTPSRSFHVLWLATHADGIRPKYLARADRSSSASMSDTLARLEAVGYVVRERGRGPDKRSVVVTVTEAGRGALWKAVDVAEPAMEELAAELFPT